MNNNVRTRSNTKHKLLLCGDSSLLWPSSGTGASPVSGAETLSGTEILGNTETSGCSIGGVGRSSSWGRSTCLRLNDRRP